MRQLNLNKTKKSVFTVTLNDEANTTLLLTMATKRLIDEFIAMNETIQSGASEDVLMDDMYSLCASILSNNKNKIKYTKEDVYDLFDIEDMVVFIQGYGEFIKDVTSQKN